MSHVPDGDLHAYIDGALEFYPPRHAKRIRDHLERCPACKRRLDEETKLAATARSVLAEASPDQLALPPLEELRRHAELGAVPERKPVRASGRVRWAWAATVVMALGIGWGVGAWPSGSGREAAVRSESQAEQDGAVQPNLTGSDAPPPAVAVAPAPPAAELETTAPSERAESQLVAAAPPSAEPKPSSDVAATPTLASEERATTLADVSIARRQAPGLPLAPLATDTPGRLPLPSDSSARPSLGLDEIVVTGAAAPTTGSGAGARRSEQVPPVSERPVVMQNRTAPGAALDLQLAGPRPQAPGAVQATEAQKVVADPTPARVPFVLEGMKVIRVSESQLGDEEAIRLQQETSDGVEVVVYFIGVPEEGGADAGAALTRDRRAAATASSPAAPPPSAAPAAPPASVMLLRPPFGMRRVVGAYRGGWVVVDSEMPEGTLRRLVEAAGVVVLR